MTGGWVVTAAVAADGAVGAAEERVPDASRSLRLARLLFALPPVVPLLRVGPEKPNRVYIPPERGRTVHTN